MAYKCEILADSISPQGHRLTTFRVTYPRIIHAEMCRHRTLSRNSASSRAIPFKKMVQMVEEDPFIPIAWQKDHKGMQGTEYWTDDDTVTVDEGDEYERYTKIYSATEHFITEWLEARDLAIAQSYELNRLGVTKQLCNRLLEPFMWHTELITGTEWENFFELRCPKYHYDLEDKYFKSKKDWLEYYKKNCIGDVSSDFTLKEEDWFDINKSQAEIHIQKIAEMMWDTMNESNPEQLAEGMWHIPFMSRIDSSKLKSVRGKDITEEMVKISTAMAARTSYTVIGDGKEIDYQKMIELHDRLIEMRHDSPFEHCAKAMSDEEYQNFRKGYTTASFRGETRGWANNYRGFIQYRYLIENQ